MGQINILNDAGTAKLSLQFTGTTNKSLNSELLSSITSDVQTQLDSKVSKSGSTMTGDLVLDNGAADGSQIVLKSAGNTDWNIDNYNGNLRFYNGSTVRAQIDSVGRVQMPYQPAFYARRTAGHLSAFTGTIIFDSTRFNVGNNYNATTGIFTAPVTGLYAFSFSALPYSTGWCEIELRKNGTEVGGRVQNRDPNSGGDGSATKTTFILMNAGDYAEIYAYNTYSYANDGLWTTFAGHLIG